MEQGAEPQHLGRLIKQINDAGGTALVVTTVAEVAEAIEKWRASA